MKIVLQACMAALICFTAGCKKDTTSPATTSPTGTPVSQNTPVPTNATSFNGVLTISSFTNISGNNTFVSSNQTAYFNKDVFSTTPVGQCLHITAVYAGNDSLMYDTTSYAPDPNRADAFIPSNNWTIKGANGIPSFSYTDSNPAPTCDNINTVLPDTISLSAGATITIKNLRNSVNSAFIIPGQLASFDTILSPGTHSIRLSPKRLSDLGIEANFSTYFYFYFQNMHAIKVAGKNFNLVKDGYILKIIYIKP